MLIEQIKSATVWLSVVTEGIAALVIAIGLIEAVFGIAAHLLRRNGSGSSDTGHESIEDIRLHFGRWLALALEFALGADILRTAVAPNWSEIGQLAAIAAVRTALNFFLQMEIDKAAARRADAPVGADDSLPSRAPPG